MNVRNFKIHKEWSALSCAKILVLKDVQSHVYNNNCEGEDQLVFAAFDFKSSHWVNISAPSSVIRIVCSNCADRLPSSVTTVQLSSHIIGLMLPIVSIGSANAERKRISILVVLYNDIKCISFTPVYINNFKVKLKDVHVRPAKFPGHILHIANMNVDHPSI